MTIPTIEDTYLEAIAVAVGAPTLRLDCLLKQLGEGYGTLYVTPKTSTKAVAIIDFRFENNGVNIRITAGDNARELIQHVSFVGGIDECLKQLTKFLQAGLLAAPSKRSS